MVWDGVSSTIISNVCSESDGKVDWLGGMSELVLVSDGRVDTESCEQFDDRCSNLSRHIQARSEERMERSSIGNERHDSRLLQRTTVERRIESNRSEIRWKVSSVYGSGGISIEAHLKVENLASAMNQRSEHQEILLTLAMNDVNRVQREPTSVSLGISDRGANVVVRPSARVQMLRILNLVDKVVETLTEGLEIRRLQEPKAMRHGPEAQAVRERRRVLEVEARRMPQQLERLLERHLLHELLGGVALVASHQQLPTLVGRKRTHLALLELWKVFVHLRARKVVNAMSSAPPQHASESSPS